jgi:hypothetical protein
MYFNSRQQHLLVPAILTLALWLSGCGADISGKLEQGGAGVFTVSAALEPRMTAVLRSFLILSQGAAAQGAGAPAAGDLLINAPAIALSLAKAPGVASAMFLNTGPSSLEGPVKIANVGEFLAPTGGRAGASRPGFIVFTENPGGGGRASITLNRETGPDMLALISPEITSYLSALLAPIATGETLTKAEYRDLAGSLYGNAVVGEISQASIRAVVEFPGPLVSVQGGSFSGSKAEFTIPLLDLLVLEQPLRYEVVWR